MSLSRLWFWTITCFASIGMCLAGLVSRTNAQSPWKNGLTMHRGLIGHTIFNAGMSGRPDTGATEKNIHSFSYPTGRRLKVYSGGSERSWNMKANSGGEGLWVLSKTGGAPHVSAAGSQTVSEDVVGMDHDPSSWPEAYLGVAHHPEYALGIRKVDGNRAEGTVGADL